MADLLSSLHYQLSEWAANAAEHGWLNKRALLLLDQSSTATPGTLFDQSHRPLVAGLFGGTGVGKSTLLNRLAGHDVARTGVERPTSRDITVYVHQSVTVNRLPDEFPMQRMHTSIHQNSDYQSVMWIDMPDFDSVETGNRELVNHWLPHIDVLIYVLSPERYRDDLGWRLLLEHGAQHAWIFILNHWDRGDARQLDDLRSLLISAGFKEPMIFCTDSSTASTEQDNPTNDEFSELERTIQSMASEQLVQQLEERGVLQRIKQLRATTDSLCLKMGSTDEISRLSDTWASSWQQTAQQLRDSSDWKIPLLASSYAEQEGSWIAQLIGRRSAKQPAMQNQADQPLASTGSMPSLIDAAFTDRTADAIETLVQQAQQAGLPRTAMSRHLNATITSLSSSPDTNGSRCGA